MVFFSILELKDDKNYVENNKWVIVKYFYDKKKFRKYIDIYGVNIF